MKIYKMLVCLLYLNMIFYVQASHFSEVKENIPSEKSSNLLVDETNQKAQMMHQQVIPELMQKTKAQSNDQHLATHSSDNDRHQTDPVTGGDSIDLSSLSSKSIDNNIKPEDRSDKVLVRSSSQRLSSGFFKKKTVDTLEISYTDSDGKKATQSFNKKDFKKAFNKASNDEQKSAVIDSMLLPFLNDDHNLFAVIKSNSEYQKFNQIMVKVLLKDSNSLTLSEQASEKLSMGLQLIADVEWTKIAKNINKTSGKVMSGLIKQISSIFNQVLMKLNKTSGTQFKVATDAIMDPKTMQIQRMGKQLKTINDSIESRTAELTRDIENLRLENEKNPKNETTIALLEKGIKDIKIIIKEKDDTISQLQQKQQQIMGDTYDTLGNRIESKSLSADQPLVVA